MHKLPHLTSRDRYGVDNVSYDGEVLWLNFGLLNEIMQECVELAKLQNKARTLDGSG